MGRALAPIGAATLVAAAALAAAWPSGTERDADAKPATVVASGRAPDGGRYEFVFERRGCLGVEWPDATAGQMGPQFGCHPSFPPDLVERSVVKAQGAMFDPGYTSHVQIAGLARADVADVQIRYEDRDGARRTAPVDFARVAGPDRAFGVFLGFLPPAWLGYGAVFDPRSCPPEERPYDPDAIEVAALDDRGNVISTVTGNNILSTSGRPPCAAAAG